MDHPESAGSERGDRVDFDPGVRLEFKGTRPGPDGGLPVMRELDDAPGLSGPASAALRDSRQGKNTVHRLDGLVRQAVHGRVVGYGDGTFGKTCIPRRCLERAFRLHLRSPELPVQPGRSAGTLCPAAWQCPQCRWLEGGSGPGDCPVCQARPQAVLPR